jgi:hypothetical protein
VIAGEIVMTYDLFSVDPNSPSFNPILDTISTGSPNHGDSRARHLDRRASGAHPVGRAILPAAGFQPALAA